MIAIVGAGPMGLAMARNLQKLGLPFVGFEAHADVGGLWDIANPHSTMYESAHLISSKRMTEFAEYPMPDDTAAYPSHRELTAYFRGYADRFDLRRHYEFSTRVVRAERTATGWSVTTDHDGTQRTREVSALLLAVGTFHTPNVPALPWTFAGRVLHSAEFKRGADLAGQRVLVVGCGNSGADIAVELVHHAASVDLSVRRGYYFLPKFVLGRPIDTLGGRLPLPRALKQRLDALVVRLFAGRPSQFGLPDPDYRMYEAHPVMNTLILHHLGQGDITPRRDLRAVDGHRVTFADGGTGEYDTILLATGYRLAWPFVDRARLNWREGDAAPTLYLNAFHPEDDTIAVLGMLEAAGLGWEGRNRQAELVALYLKQLAAGRASARAFQQRKRAQAGHRVDGGFRYLALPRMAYYVHKESYLATLDREIARLREDLVA